MRITSTPAETARAFSSNAATADRLRRTQIESLAKALETERASLTAERRRLEAKYGADAPQVKAIARRVERGSLRSVVRSGRRRIPRSELVRAGLLGDGRPEPREGDPAAPFLPRPAPGGALAETGGSEDMLAQLFREVLDRFER